VSRRCSSPRLIILRSITGSPFFDAPPIQRDLRLELGIVGLEMECVEAVDDSAHQVAHLDVIEL